MDMDESGSLDKQEFENSLLEMGIFTTKQELNLIYNRIDNTKNGEIDFRELHKVIAPYHSKIN